MCSVRSGHHINININNNNHNHNNPTPTSALLRVTYLHCVALARREAAYDGSEEENHHRRRLWFFDVGGFTLEQGNDFVLLNRRGRDVIEVQSQSRRYRCRCCEDKVEERRLNTGGNFFYVLVDSNRVVEVFGLPSLRRIPRGLPSASRLNWSVCLRV